MLNVTRRSRFSSDPRRADALHLFAANLSKTFYAFEPDFLQQNLVRIVDDVVSVIKGSIESVTSGCPLAARWAPQVFRN